MRRSDAIKFKRVLVGHFLGFYDQVIKHLVVVLMLILLHGRVESKRGRIVDENVFIQNGKCEALICALVNDGSELHLYFQVRLGEEIIQEEDEKSQSVVCELAGVGEDAKVTRGACMIHVLPCSRDLAGVDLCCSTASRV